MDPFNEASTPNTGTHVCSDGQRLNLADVHRANPRNIQRGLMPGSRPETAVGFATTDAVERSPVAPYGEIYMMPVEGDSVTVSSTAAADSADGDNIQRVRIYYLDADLVPRELTVYLDGTTGVTTDVRNIRWIQCMHADRAGTSGEAAGDIVAEHDGGTVAMIAQGQSRCTSSYRMVPAGVRLLIHEGVAASTSATADSRTTFEIVSNQILGRIYSDPVIWFSHAFMGAQNGSVASSLEALQPFDPGAVVGVRHTTNKTSTVSFSWGGSFEAPAAINGN